jgi:hypothetical protein
MRIRSTLIILSAVLLAGEVLNCESGDNHQINDNPYNLPYKIGLTFISTKGSLFGNGIYDTFTVDSIYRINNKDYLKFSTKNYQSIENDKIYCFDGKSEELLIDFTKKIGERYWNIESDTLTGRIPLLWLRIVLDTCTHYTLNFNGKDTIIKVFKQDNYLFRDEYCGRDPYSITTEELKNASYYLTTYQSKHLLGVEAVQSTGSNRLLSIYFKLLGRK